MHIIACASGNSIVLQRGMHIYAKCRTKLTQQLSSSFLRDADGLTVYCKARDNYGVRTGETLNFTCEMSNRVRLLLHLHLDTFFRRDLYNRGNFVWEFSGSELLFLQSTQLAHLITRRTRLLYGEIDILQKILRQYRFLKEIMNTHRVLDLTLFCSI